MTWRIRQDEGYQKLMFWTSGAVVSSQIFTIILTKQSLACFICNFNGTCMLKNVLIVVNWFNEFCWKISWKCEIQLLQLIPNILLSAPDIHTSACINSIYSVYIQTAKYIICFCNFMFIYRISGFVYHNLLLCHNITLRI